MLSREEVQSNRSRIRGSLKVCLVTPNVQPMTLISSEPNGGEPARHAKRTSRHRKHSENLELFKNGIQVKDIYIADNFFDRFVVQEKLGEGAQSVVMRCTDRLSGINYAVKKFGHCDSELIEMLKVQYRILTELNHPNIIEGYSLYVDEKTMSCQMVLEYCSYPTLAKVITDEPLTPQESARVVSKLLLAIEYLHRNGVCHRDIKPQNILYDRTTGDLKLIDFEIAKVHRTRTERFEMWSNTGSLFYKAPEMFASGYNQLVDVWALGVVTYELMTGGQLPFHDRYEMETINRIKHASLLIPEWVPLPAKDFIQKCLEKNSLKRPTSQELLQHPLISGLLAETEENLSPPNFKSKSCGGKTRRNSDAAESFSIHVLPVMEEEIPLEPHSPQSGKTKSCGNKTRRNSEAVEGFSLSVFPVMEEEDSTEPDTQIELEDCDCE